MKRIMSIITIGIALLALEYASAAVVRSAIQEKIGWHRVYIQWGILDESKHLGH